MSVYPPVEELLAQQSDGNLLEVHRALRSILSNFAIFLFSTLVLYGIVYFIGTDGGMIRIPWFGFVSVRWFAIIPALFLIEIVRKYHDDLYLISTTRTTHREGRLSLKSSVPSLKHEDIRSITVRQDIVGRIFNFGDVLLSSAAQGNVELTMSGVHAPHELALLLDQLRSIQVAQKQSQRPDGGMVAMGGE